MQLGNPVLHLDEEVQESVQLRNRALHLSAQLRNRVLHLEPENAGDAGTKPQVRLSQDASGISGTNGKRASGSSPC